MLPPFWISDRGRWGEYLVKRYYHRQGYHCLARNWRHGSGEIDLIMGSPRHVVFLEVKTRKARQGLRLGDTLRATQEARLLGLARVYLQQWPDNSPPWTFRLVLVQFRKKGRYVLKQATLV